MQQILLNYAFPSYFPLHLYFMAPGRYEHLLFSLLYCWFWRGTLTTGIMVSLDTVCFTLWGQWKICQYSRLLTTLTGFNPNLKTALIGTSTCRDAHAWTQPCVSKPVLVFQAGPWQKSSDHFSVWMWDCRHTLMAVKRLPLLGRSKPSHGNQTPQNPTSNPANTELLTYLEEKRLFIRNSFIIKKKSKCLYTQKKCA